MLPFVHWVIAWLTMRKMKKSYKEEDCLKDPWMSFQCMYIVYEQQGMDQSKLAQNTTQESCN